MASSPLVDLSSIPLDGEAVPIDDVRVQLPQRYEFALIDRVCWIDRERGIVVATKDFGPGDWWAKGHFPGKPIVPGILMVEGAAQTGTVLWKELQDLEGITIGFGGLEKVRFRGQVEPPARMYFLAGHGPRSSRMARFPTQAVVDGKVVYEGTVLGVAL